MLFQDCCPSTTFKVQYPDCEQHPQNKSKLVKLPSAIFNQRGILTKNDVKLCMICEECKKAKKNAQHYGNFHNDSPKKIPRLNLNHNNVEQSQILSISEFTQKLAHFLESHKHYLKKDGLIIDIDRIFREKRQELIQHYENTKITLINKLNKEQQRMIQEYDRIKNYYEAKQKQSIDKLEQRTNIVQYISQYFDLESQYGQKEKNLQEVLQMKLYMSNQYGLDNFMQQINNLIGMYNQFQYRNINSIIQSIKKQLDGKLSNSLLSKVDNLCHQSVNLNSNRQCIISFEERNHQSSKSKNKSFDNQRTHRTQSYQNLPKIPISPQTARHQKSFRLLPRPPL